MDKPKCRVCGERHGPGEPHVWKTLGEAIRDGDVVITRIKAAPAARKAAETMADQVEGLTGTRPAFDRTAYQREYMRKRRAQPKP